MIRGESVSEDARESLSDFLYALKTLEGHVAAGRFTEAKMMQSYVDRIYRSCTDEFRQQ